jgi:hypothetical protein
VTYFKVILFSETFLVCFGNYMKHINTPCGQNTEHLSVKASGTYEYVNLCAFKARDI